MKRSAVVVRRLKEDADAAVLPELRSEHKAYSDQMLKLWLLASLLSDVELDDLHELQTKAATVQPVKDPMLPRFTSAALAEDVALVNAAILFQENIAHLKQRWEKKR